MNLYFDIETRKAPGFIVDRSAIKAPGNVKDPAKIAAAIEKKAKEQEEKAGLNSFHAAICSIAWAFDDGHVFECTGINEEHLLIAFEDSIKAKLEKSSDISPTWIGHNIINFDLDFLHHRAIKYKLTFLKAILPDSGRSPFIFDTMEHISPTIWKPLISLKNACAYFGIKTPKGDIDGSKVQSYFDAGKLKEIGDYCKEDVRAERELYYLLK